MRQVILFLMLILTPLAIVVWLGVRVSHNEQEVVRRRFEDLLQAKLRDTRLTIQALVEKRQREWLKITDVDTPDIDNLQNRFKAKGYTNPFFILSPNGRLSYPSPEQPLSSIEREFLKRNRSLLLEKGFSPSITSTDGSGGDLLEQNGNSGDGWHVSFWERGINVVFWRRTLDGYVVGTEWPRIQLLSEIIEQLPSTDPNNPDMPHGRITLHDSKGASIYRWGNYRPPESESPRVTIALKEPLRSWRLSYHASPALMEAPLQNTARTQLWTALSAAGIVVIVLAFLFFREYQRQVRDAATRVNFVNQVSHELKTPLTNIRMYAELLEQRLDEHDKEAHAKLSVILSESQRLTRLIGNVLTFGQGQRQQLKLHRRSACIDELIQKILSQFQPAFNDRQIEVTFNGAAPQPVEVDADALGQILGNLFSNVEKYGASGKHLEVSSTQDNDSIRITVIDRGPGIPNAMREKIFAPFKRVSNKLSDGVTGAGIGLTIARELAQLHDGTLVLVPSAIGACFQIDLKTPKVKT